MAEIKVTPQELKSKADELQNLNRQFRSEVEKMSGYEAELSGMWDGEAKEAFRKAFNDDKGKWERFAINIDKYILALRENASQYETAERMAVNTASNRSYGS